MNKRERMIHRQFKIKHGKKFADYLYEKKALTRMFDDLYGWSYTRVLLDFALDKIPQIEQPLTEDEKRSIY